MGWTYRAMVGAWGVRVDDLLNSVVIPHGVHGALLKRENVMAGAAVVS